MEAASALTFFFCEREDILIKMEHSVSPQTYTQDLKEKENYIEAPRSHVHLLRRLRSTQATSMGTNEAKTSRSSADRPQSLV